MRVLVVTTVERSSEAVRALVGDAAAEVKIVVPAVRQSRAQWLANDDDGARTYADKAAREIAAEVPQPALAEAGDADPLLAAEDALRQFRADELVVITHPSDEASWLEDGREQEMVERLGLPVRALVVDEAGIVRRQRSAGARARP